MFFKRKKKKSSVHCKNCNSSVESKFSFCPHCGFDLIDHVKEEQDFGLLGRTDSISEDQIESPFTKMRSSITDKMMNSIFNSLVKILGEEMRNFEQTERIEEFPNGIRIQFGLRPVKAVQQKKKQRAKGMTQEQIDRMSSLPRAPAKTSVKRLNNRLIYELTTPGIQAVDDVIFSRTESGYEVKAIGKNKVYVCNIPVSLSLKEVLIDSNKTIIEFSQQ